MPPSLLQPFVCFKTYLILEPKLIAHHSLNVTCTFLPLYLCSGLPSPALCVDILSQCISDSNAYRSRADKRKQWNGQVLGATGSGGDCSRLESVCLVYRDSHASTQVIIARLERGPRILRSDFAREDRIPDIYKYSKVSMLATNLQNIFWKISRELNKTHTWAHFASRFPLAAQNAAICESVSDSPSSYILSSSFDTTKPFVCLALWYLPALCVGDCCTDFRLTMQPPKIRDRILLGSVNLKVGQKLEDCFPYIRPVLVSTFLNGPQSGNRALYVPNN